MIECTSSADTIARLAFGKENVAISNIKNMTERFKLDPATSPVAREAFIVTDMDLTRKNKEAFLNAAANKHKDVVIVYIARKGKSDIKEGNGINAVLEKPTEEKLADTVFSIVEEISKKTHFNLDNMENDNTPEEYGKDLENTEVLTDAYGNPLEFEYADEQDSDEQDNSEDEEPIDLDVDLNTEKEDEPEEPVIETEQNLIDRLNACQKVSEIAEFTRELKVTDLIKDIVRNQADYTGLEDRIKGINEKISSIYMDATIPTQDKLDKVRAALCDKNYYRSKTNTILEQRIEELIDTITLKTKEFIDKRCGELDRIIANCAVNEPVTSYSSRIAGLLNERSNIMLEITALQSECQDIYANMDKLAKGVASEIVESSTAETGSRLVDERLALIGGSTVPDHAVDSIENILTRANEKNSDFEAIKKQLIAMNHKLIKLMNLDKELIDALNRTVEILQANRVEDRVYKETLVKKALRIFIAEPGTGKTVVPYILSELKSRQHENVLYIDVTGSCKLANYSETPRDLEDWMVNQYHENCCIVAGTLQDSPEAAQRLLVALTKAADFYRVINLVMTPEQRTAFDIIVPNVLSTNYILDNSTTDFDFYYKFIRDTQYENVAQRVIINRCIPSTLNIVLDKLDIIKDLDVHVATIPYEPVITESSLRKIKPYEIQAVQAAFGEVCKVC